MDHSELRRAFEKHEAVCAERWKTIFNKIEEFDERSTSRFEEHKKEFCTFRRIAIGGLGTAVIFLLSILGGQYGL